MRLDKLFRHDGEPCWLGLRRSFWLHLLFTLFAVCGLITVWWYGLWLVRSEAIDQIEALEKRVDACQCAQKEE